MTSDSKMSSNPAYKNIDAIVASNEEKIPELRQNIRNFCTKVRAAILDGSINLGELYPRYEKMEPTLHKHCKSDILDIDALIYALQRLPSQEIAKITSTYIQSNPEYLKKIPGVKTLESKMRRRAMYLGREGYLKIIAREDETDIFDILTSLIMFGKETNKIKKKLTQECQSSDCLIDNIRSYTSNNNPETKNQTFMELGDLFDLEYNQIKRLDDVLDHNLCNFITDIIDNNPKDMKIRFDNEFSRTDASSKAKLWRKRIEETIQFDDNRPINIVSSNTHSVVNCLTGFAEEYKDRIIELAKKDELLKDMDFEDMTSLYFISQKLIEKNKELRNDKIKYEEEAGIRFIKDYHNTGIDVQVIDLDKIDCAKMDSRITKKLKPNICKSKYIINMDYAFGRQGIEVMRELCHTFGKRIESISIMGKAGIVCGNKYDIMLPSYFVSQIEGGIYDLPARKNNLNKKDLEGLTDENKVHTEGPMLTVQGTAIQNNLVLKYYMSIYGILGLEMEGIPYIEAIHRAYTRKLLQKDIKINVGYWGSDNPLKASESLSEDHMDKGNVPTYALTIAMLKNILNTCE